MSLRLALLDRDGTLNVKAPEGEYIERPDDLVLLPGAAAAVARLNAAGVLVALVTNQRGVARGRMSLDDLESVHVRLRALLAAAGGHLDGVYVCPHQSGSCACRKPEPGMLLAALDDFGVAAGDAIMVGDAASDVEAGRRAGVRTVQLTVEGGGSAADAAVPTLADAVALLLAGD